MKIQIDPKLKKKNNNSKEYNNTKKKFRHKNRRMGNSVSIKNFKYRIIKGGTIDKNKAIQQEILNLKNTIPLDDFLLEDFNKLFGGFDNAEAAAATATDSLYNSATETTSVENHIYSLAK